MAAFTSLLRTPIVLQTWKQLHALWKNKPKVAGQMQRMARLPSLDQPVYCSSTRPGTLLSFDDNHPDRARRQQVRLIPLPPILCKNGRQGRQPNTSYRSTFPGPLPLVVSFLPEERHFTHPQKWAAGPPAEYELPLDVSWSTPVGR